MLAAAYFKILVAGPLAMYMLFLIVREAISEYGHADWRHVLISVLVRFLYAAIFAALCAQGVRYVRSRRRQ